MMAKSAFWCEQLALPDPAAPGWPMINNRLATTCTTLVNMIGTVHGWRAADHRMRSSQCRSLPAASKPRLYELVNYALDPGVGPDVGAGEAEAALLVLRDRMRPVDLHICGLRQADSRPKAAKIISLALALARQWRSLFRYRRATGTRTDDGRRAGRTAVPCCRTSRAWRWLDSGLTA